MSEALVAHPEWLRIVLDLELLSNPRREETLRREVSELLKPALARRDFPVALAQLRRLQQREHLRIAARDLARLGTAQSLWLELSNVADLCLDAVLQICLTQLTERVGSPWHLDAEKRWQPTPFCVLGLGRLGGQELGYGDDVELLFVYAEEGEAFKTPPRPADAGGKGLSSHEFFRQLAEQFLTEVAQPALRGALYRMDMRHRPEGEAGPLVRSLASYENHYAQCGNAIERMSLIKARGVAGDAGLATEFLEILQPFRYPRYLSEHDLVEIAAGKQNIEAKAGNASELNRNIKLGPGSLREIEFVVQTLQLLNAGKSPFLQNAQTLSTLERLVRHHLLSADDAVTLTEACCFGRELEHRLQLDNNLQQHLLPTERKARERLAALMGFARLSDFEVARQSHCAGVRRMYGRCLPVEVAVVSMPLPIDFGENERQWLELLATKSFRDPAKAVKLLDGFVNGYDGVQFSQRASGLARRVLQKFFALCPSTAAAAGNCDCINLPLPMPVASATQAGASQIEGENSTRNRRRLPRTRAGHLFAPVLSDPDSVLARLHRFIVAYGSHVSLYEAWDYNPRAFELLLWLFDRSEFLSELAIRSPELVDELEQSGQLRHAKAAGDILTELRHGVNEVDQHGWLRRYHQAESMRIGLRDILGVADSAETFAELSALADACLRYALEVTLQRHERREPSLAIIGLGPLGGAELSYGNSLDVLFVTDDRAHNLPALQNLAADVLDFLSTKTDFGTPFAIETRQRPGGDQGPLVSSLGTYEDYYQHRAQLGEILALSRARFIAGNVEVGRDFEQLSVELCDFRQDDQRSARLTQGLGGSSDTVRIAGRLTPDTGLLTVSRCRPSCYKLEWLALLAKARRPLEQERTPLSRDVLAFRTGTGGLADAEFLAQSFCLARGWHEPNTLRALERARQSGALPAKDANTLIANYRQLRVVEKTLRRSNNGAEGMLPDDAVSQTQIAIQCGFSNREDFLNALTTWRANVRRVVRNALATSG